MMIEDKIYHIKLPPKYEGFLFSIRKTEAGKVQGRLLSLPGENGVPHHCVYVENTQQEVFEKAKRDILKDYSGTPITRQVAR